MAKSRAQQAAIAVSMKKAGKKPKKQLGGTSGNVPSPYGGTGANKPKSNKSAIIAGIIGTGVGAISAAVAKRKKQKQKKREDEVKEWIQSEVNENDLKRKYGGLPKGYHKMPDGSVMKDSAHKMKKGGSTPAWTRKEGKNPEGGLNAKGVASYRAANPGSKLKTAVTTKPSKLDPDSKAAKRRKSFCSRMSGMKKKLTSAKTANDPNSRINKSLRKWNC